MKVELLYYTPENIGMPLIARMARSTRLGELEEERPRPKNESEAKQNAMKDSKYIDGLLNVEHDGVLEHITFTFHVSEISRCLTHQLVRHRIASYLQMSSRHVVVKEHQYVVPPSFRNDGKILYKYNKNMEAQWNIYKKAIDDGIPKEDARYLLPDGFYTHISLTMNCRSLKHLFQLRCAPDAQWEIRDMATRILKICYSKYPVLFEREHAKLVREKTEGK